MPSPRAKMLSSGGRGGPGHDVALGRLLGQGKAGQAVGDEVHPEDVDRQQRHGHAQERREEHHPDLAGVAGQGVPDELADVVVDPPALAHSGDDGREPVVEQDHVRGLAGDVRAPFAHGDADLGLPQRGGVVDPVAGHRHALAAGLQGAHDPDLLLGIHPRVHPHAADCVGEGSVVHLAQGRSGQHRGLGGPEDAHSTGDRSSGGGVVAGDHRGGDARRAALGHGCRRLWTRRVDHADHAQQREPVRDLRWRGPPRRVRLAGVIEARGGGQDPQSLAGQGIGARQHLAARRGGEGAQRDDRLGGALDQGAPAPAGLMVDGHHQLASRVEGDLVDPR